MRHNKLNPYQAASLTVSSGRQIVMLYDGVIKSLKQGLEAIQDKNYRYGFECLDTASKIINGLEASLDETVNQEIADSLKEYYHSLDVRIILFQHNHDMEVYDRLVEDLRNMRDVWYEAENTTTAHEGMAN